MTEDEKKKCREMYRESIDILMGVNKEPRAETVKRITMARKRLKAKNLGICETLNMQLNNYLKNYEKKFNKHNALIDNSVHSFEATLSYIKRLKQNMISFKEINTKLDAYKKNHPEEYI